MINASFEQNTSAVLKLFTLQANLENKFSATLGSVHGLSLNDLLLLLNVSLAPLEKMRRVDLAAALAMSQSSVTRMTAPLEKIGLLERESAQHDARIAYVLLTSAGRKAIKNAVNTLEHLTKDVFSDRWNTKEIASFDELLGRLTAHLPGNLR
jgi:DNA-binding MarR family transcriptional regulator